MTANVVSLVIKALNEREIEPNIVGMLSYGNWSESLPHNKIKDLLITMINHEYLEPAVSILTQRLKSRPEEMDYLEGISLDLVTRSELIRSEGMTNYYWKQVASQLVAKFIAYS